MIYFEAQMIFCLSVLILVIGTGDELRFYFSPHSDDYMYDICHILYERSIFNRLV